VIILLETYTGCSDFCFVTSCTGRQLEEAELREKGFVSDAILRNNEHSSYVWAWYEVKEGDRIRVVRWDDEGDIDETFIVPADLPNPPQQLDDIFRTGKWVYDYLVEHCTKAV
jgi:hypothetical protein